MIAEKIYPFVFLDTSTILNNILLKNLVRKNDGSAH